MAVAGYSRSCFPHSVLEEKPCTALGPANWTEDKNRTGCGQDGPEASMTVGFGRVQWGLARKAVRKMDLEVELNLEIDPAVWEAQAFLCSQIINTETKNVKHAG